MRRRREGRVERPLDHAGRGRTRLRSRVNSRDRTPRARDGVDPGSRGRSARVHQARPGSPDRATVMRAACRRLPVDSRTQLRASRSRRQEVLPPGVHTPHRNRDGRQRGSRPRPPSGMTCAVSWSVRVATPAWRRRTRSLVMVCPVLNVVWVWVTVARRWGVAILHDVDDGSVGHRPITIHKSVHCGETPAPRWQRPA